MLKNRKGQVGTGIINLLVGIILIVAVLIPVTIEVIENQSFTGTTGTITNLFPVLEAVAGLVLIAGSIFLASR